MENTPKTSCWRSLNTSSKIQRTSTVCILNSNDLTDRIGVRVAHYIKVSISIVLLGLHSNRFTEVTYLAVAAALRVNTSLRTVFLFENAPVDKHRVDAAFFRALCVNTPTLHAAPKWKLYECDYIDFTRLKIITTKPQPVSMLAQLERCARIRITKSRRFYFFFINKKKRWQRPNIVAWRKPS